MCTTITRDQASDLAASLVEAQIAGPTDNVTIAGCNQLELLIALSNRGLRHATCRDAKNGPHGGEPATDILVIPDIDSETQLSATVARLGHELRQGGSIVAITPPSDAARMTLRRVLVSCGFIEMHALTVSGGRTLVCARKPATIAARAA